MRITEGMTEATSNEARHLEVGVNAALFVAFCKIMHALNETTNALQFKDKETFLRDQWELWMAYVTEGPNEHVTPLIVDDTWRACDILLSHTKSMFEPDEERRIVKTRA